MLRLFLIFISLAFSTNARAADFNLGLDASAGWGKASNQANSIASRSLVTYSLGAQPAYVCGDWLFGVNLDYGLRRQLTEVSEVSSTNLKGGGYSAGLIAKYRIGDVTARAQLDLSGNYGLSYNDTVGQEIKYRCDFGFCGFGIGASLPVWDNLDGILSFRYQRWGRVDVNSIENDISNNKLIEWKFLAGLAWDFDL